MNAAPTADGEAEYYPKVIAILQEDQLVSLESILDQGERAGNIPITAFTTYNYLTSDHHQSPQKSYIIALRITKVKLKRISS